MLMENFPEIFRNAHEIVMNSNNKEIFIVVQHQKMVEINDRRLEISNKLNTGMACRKFHETHTEHFFVDGIKKEQLNRLMSAKSGGAILPPTRMSSDKIDAASISDAFLFEFNDFQNIKKIERDYRSDYEALMRTSKDSRIDIFDCCRQCDTQLFYYANSNGVSGSGMRKLFASSIEIERPNCFNPSRSVAFSLDIIENSLVELLNQDSVGVCTVYDNTIPTHTNLICFSNLATSKLLFYFANLLTTDAIKNGCSFVTEANKEEILLSENLSIVENSISNRISNGAIDCEGVAKLEVPIIQSGRIQKFISNITASDDNRVSTGSAYRENHRQPPYAKPTKLAVLGSKTTKEILNEYTDFIYITDLQGIEQSMNPLTTQFNAAVNMCYYKNKILHKTNHSKKISTSILELFANIVEISGEGIYGVDGSILSGIILVENQGII
jgi:predicted Zn-dependent protease